MYEEEKKRMLTGNHGDQGEGRKKRGKSEERNRKKKWTKAQNAENHWHLLTTKYGGHGEE